MIEQGSPEWRLARVGRVTGSRVDAVIAEGRGNKPSATRENYIAELLCERLTGIPYESGYTDANMRRGIELEPLAALAYEVETGVQLEPCGFIEHPTIAMSGATPDRIAGPGLVEIKVPMTKTHLGYIQAGKPPPDYIPQMTWQIACTRRPFVDFVSWDPRLPEDLQLFITRFVPHPSHVAELEHAVIAFLLELDERVVKLNQLREARWKTT